jgi:hypothetical protein
LLQYQNLVIHLSPVIDRQIPMRNQRGFSLIEALIAMVLLIVGLLVARRIKANANAAGRTSGVAVDDPLLKDGGDNGSGLNNGKAVAGGNPTPGNADQSAGQITTAQGFALVTAILLLFVAHGGADGRRFCGYGNNALRRPATVRGQYQHP